MLRHFPFTDKFDLRMGTSPLTDTAPMIECDEHYEEEVALKRKLLEGDPRYYFRADADLELAQWEALDAVLTCLATHYPDRFQLTRQGSRWQWYNSRLGEDVTFTFGDGATLPLAPLDWVGRQVQEDLILLDPSMVVKAGQLCFPSGWDLDEKFGKHFLAVHEPLPRVTNPMIETAGKFIERLPVGKTFQRNNWGFRVCRQLDLSSRHSKAYAEQLTRVASSLTPATVGDNIYIRIEHQTLSRLPLSGCVLFTIHTYQSLLGEEVKAAGRAKTLHSFLKDVPEELQQYKLIRPYWAVMLDYLKSCA